MIDTFEVKQRVVESVVNTLTVSVDGEVKTVDLESWAKYIATNANGRIRQYECEPHSFKTQDSWFSSNTYGKVRDVILVEPPANYMDTMVKL